MKVLFLGAGASIAAGYPPASKLLDELEKELSDTPHVNVGSQWRQFVEFRQKAKGTLAEVLHSPNPETVVSQIDLLLKAREDRDVAWWSTLSGDHPYDTESAAMKEAENAISGLIAALDHFFTKKHREDQLGGGENRAYLREKLESLQAGDVVLTTNWDTLAERTLSGIERWYPTDGYGFEVPVKPAGLAQASRRLGELSSQIRVLKLHGSVGWHSLERKGSCYLRFANYLQFLPVLLDDQAVLVRDPAEVDRPYGFHEPQVLIRPSYLKSLESPVLSRIWHQAEKVLRSADTIEVIGYSLPESDAAIRTLLNSLRERLATGQVAIKVVDPDYGTLHRWRNLVGEGANLVREKFGPSDPGNDKPT